MAQGRSESTNATEVWDERSGMRPRAIGSEVRDLVRPHGFEAFGMTDRGRVREKNQDQFLVATLERAIAIECASLGFSAGAGGDMRWRQGVILMVADGMGGYEGGEVASKVVIEQMARYCFEQMPWLHNGAGPAAVEIKEGLKQALEECVPRVREAAATQHLDWRMGTTFTMAYVEYPRVYLVHVGDSRCYLFQGGSLTRITRDHTVAQQLVDQELIAEHEVSASPYRHVLLNAVGGEADDLFVDVQLFEVSAGDQLLLCTDGLTGALDEHVIADELEARNSVGETIRNLIDSANEAGGHDNITAVLGRF
jgi:protein phosphatase